MESLKPYSKAIAAALAGALLTFLAQHGIVVSSDISQALQILLGALITAIIVYVSPRNTPPPVQPK